MFSPALPVADWWMQCDCAFACGVRRSGLQEWYLKKKKNSERKYWSIKIKMHSQTLMFLYNELLSYICQNIQFSLHSYRMYLFPKNTISKLVMLVLQCLKKWAIVLLSQNDIVFHLLACCHHAVIYLTSKDVYDHQWVLYNPVAFSPHVISPSILGYNH